VLHAILAETLIIASPGAHRGRLLQLAVFRRKGRVPPGEKRSVRFYLNQPGHVVLPRGLLPKVQAMMPVQIVDRRLVLPPIDFGWRGELRPEQAEAARALVRARGGIVEGMPGSGKTNTGLAIAAVFRQPVLWLTHTKDLARQATGRAKSLYNLPPKAFGYIGEGEYGLGTHLTVGMIQSLAKNPQLVEEIRRKFGCLIIDECHHLPAITIAKVVSLFPAMYRVGLTATIERTDGLSPLAMAILGQDVATIDRQQLLAQGRILLPFVRVIRTGWRHWGAADWSVLQKARASDLRRNELVCSLVAREVREGRRVIVLVELVVHAKFLAAALTQRYKTPAVAVTKDVGPLDRIKAYDAVGQGKLVLVATKLADEGLDLPSLTCLVLAAPGRSAPRLEQQIGRVMRSFRGKTSAVVYDLADTAVDVFRSQAEERLGVYYALGLRVERHSVNSGPGT
jgi:superfamily II DNA or RNA helicase